MSAHHERDIRAVDIGVEQPHATSQGSESDRYIHRYRGLSNATFSGSDGDEMADARDWHLRRLLLLGMHDL
jgi:hypothetical protein